MNQAISRFLSAHDRYLELDRARTGCSSAVEREFIHEQIMMAYLEVHHFARIIAGLQYADGMDFADVN